MGGFFGTIGKKECVSDLFYGTDYNSHLGTKRAGLATFSQENGLTRSIHNIEGSYFRSKFEAGLSKFAGATSGIGVISDTDAQPIIIHSHLGKMAIVTVAKLDNIDELEQDLLSKNYHFTELSSGKTNQTEVIASLVCEGKTIQEGIENVFNKVQGSCSFLILRDNGEILACRDRLGRTPIIIGKKDGAFAVSSETNAFPNLDYSIDYFVGPGEIVQITANGWNQVRKPNDKMQVCSFFWVYYGFPSCDYEGINVDMVRNKLGEKLGQRDESDVDFVCGIPDSGIGHALGYAYGKGVPYKRGILKYTPTWPRSFTPSNQITRNLIAKMKLIPNKQILDGQRVVFLDDSIVRGTQLRDNVTMLYDCGAKEVHMRIACPPLVHPCKFLNFSSSKSELELMTRSIIKDFEGEHDIDLDKYVNPDDEKYKAMVEVMRKRFNLSSLEFTRVDDLIEAIGLPKDKVCTHCFDGSSYF